MNFYIHRGHLEEHLGRINGQLAQVRHLQDQLRQLLVTDMGVDAPVLQRNLRRLRTVEQCLMRVQEVFREHMESTAAYSHRLSDELDEIIRQSQRVFD